MHSAPLDEYEFDQRKGESDMYLWTHVYSSPIQFLLFRLFTDTRNVLYFDNSVDKIDIWETLQCYFESAVNFITVDFGV